MFATLVFALLTQAAASSDGTTVARATVMTRAEKIRENNAKLPHDDPAYIRCVREEETGSLIKARAICRTNAEWRRTDDIGNNNARGFVDAMSTRVDRSSDDPPQPK